MLLGTGVVSFACYFGFSYVCLVGNSCPDRVVIMWFQMSGPRDVMSFSGSAVLHVVMSFGSWRQFSGACLGVSSRAFSVRAFLGVVPDISVGRVAF